MGVLDLGKVVGPQGKQGDPGRDGTDGTPGAPGTPGADGKSAYQYAKEGGFVGTEEQFYTALAEVVLKMNKVIPQKVDSIATLSAAGQVQDSGKTLANLATAEQIANVYTKTEANQRFAVADNYYTKNQTMTAATGQLIGSGVTTPDLAFQKLKEQVNTAQEASDNKTRIVVGTYSGNGKSSQTIQLPFTPKAVFVLNLGYNMYNPGGFSLSGGLAVTGADLVFSNGSSVNLDALKIGTNKFIVYFVQRTDGTSLGVYLNTNNSVFHYIAFE